MDRINSVYYLFGAFAAGGEPYDQAQRLEMEMATSKSVTLTTSLSARPKYAAETFAVTIKATAYNKSSSALADVVFDFQDSSGSGAQVLAKIDLGTMAPGQSLSGTTTLPTGFEVVTCRIFVPNDANSPYLQVGFGNNATEVTIDITD